MRLQHLHTRWARQRSHADGVVRMERAQLQASHSAPDLTDLIEARLNDTQLHAAIRNNADDEILDGQGSDGESSNNLKGHIQHGGLIDNDDDDDDEHDHSNGHAGETLHGRWRQDQLPTPAPSRSPTPDIPKDPTETYGHSMDEADAYSFRLRSETPDIPDFSHNMRPKAIQRASSLSDVNRLRRYLDATGDSQTQSDNDTPLDTAREESVEPSSPTSPAQSQILPTLGSRLLPASLWDYLQEEISASDLDGSQEMKAERVTNFFSVPMAVEQVSLDTTYRVHPKTQRCLKKPLSQIIIFGYFVCLDSFLYTFTILPLRFLIALRRWVASYFKPGKRKSLPVSAKCDLAKCAIFLVTCITLHYLTDASKMYHSVRGQEVIKLYVIYNVLEVNKIYRLSASGELPPESFSRRLRIDYAALSDKIY